MRSTWWCAGHGERGDGPSGRDLYSFEISGADADHLIAVATGKGAMTGDTWAINEDGELTHRSEACDSDALFPQPGGRLFP